MEGLIIWLIILGFAIYNSKKKKNAKKAGEHPQNYQRQQSNQQELKNRLQQKYAGAATRANATPVRQNVPYRAPQQRPVQQAQHRPMQQAPQQRPMQQAPQQRPVQQAPQQNDIMSRAVANVKVNEVDELERSQSATAINAMSADVHNLIGMVDVAKSSELMAQLNDLMIMGYQADLSFERDFIAEGVDMLNSYELPEI